VFPFDEPCAGFLYPIGNGGHVLRCAPNFEIFPFRCDTVPFRGLNLYVYTPTVDAPASGMRMGAIWTSSDRVALMTRLQRQSTLYIPHDD
jgi:hypothetical protein